MKNLTLLITLLLGAATCFSQIDKDPADYVILNGHLKADNKKCKDVVVTVFDKNKKEQIHRSAKNGEFMLELDLNKYYTLKFEKEGIITKYVIFDTAVKKPKDFVMEYEFHVDLFSSSVFNGVDISDLDFPMAIISINESSGELQHEESYTQMMQTKYDKLLFKAKENALAIEILN